MCGICGFFSKQPISLEQLKHMNDRMYHRGPDDSGEELHSFGEYTLGFAQRRLSILDLSPLGHQPMHSDNNDISVVFNGEIYNFSKLKVELKDYNFHSNCDTEVIIAAYLKWGVHAIQKLHGMFAIALFDKRTETLYLIRDRIGKKPLYYWVDEKNIVFASELKPIMACPGFRNEIDVSVMTSYMYNLYINAPRSIFKNVYKLEPGSVLEYHYGELKKYKYWDIPSIYHQNKLMKVNSYQEAKESLKELLIESVKNRMVADVPVGTFLSGGYDSSLITAIAQSVAIERVKTFCIGFRIPKYDEALYAKKVADYLGTNHHELYIDEQDVLKLVNNIPQYYDEPFADSSQIPSMLVSKFARDDVTVVLSGDGGDELFCGYNYYPKIRQAQMIDFLGGLTYFACNFPGLKRFKIIDCLPINAKIIAQNRNKKTKTQIGLEASIEIIRNMLIYPGISEKFEIEDRYSEENWQARRMLLDEETYLPGDILCKVDRASMGYSLETRCPFLDTAVVEYSYRIPHEYKYMKGDKKHILKDIAYDYLPENLLNRPKTGFSVPLDEWLRGPLREQLIDFSRASYLKAQGVFEPFYTQKLIDTYLEKGDRKDGIMVLSTLIWTFFVFEQWYRFYIE